MLREYFCHRKKSTTAFAWGGLLVFVGHQLFRAYLKRAINAWYETFYDLLGSHISREIGVRSANELAALGWNVTFDSNATNATNATLAGNLTDAEWASRMARMADSYEAADVADSLADARAQVWAELLNFAMLVAPAVLIHPVAGLVRNMWVLWWRLALTRSYLGRWNAKTSTLEGAAQRVHEDCMRFGRGIHGVVAQSLDSILTLALFAPLLYDRDPMLMYLALGTATGGIGVSALVGRHLVGLEVQNQRVEAALRTDLVKLELDIESVRQNGSIPAAFYMVIDRLVANYRRLYANFFVFGFWLSAFEQTMTVLPYVVLAPRLFAADPADALTLGQLTASASAFDKVFSAITVISDDWMSITEFLSVVRRLRQFEAVLGDDGPSGDTKPPVRNGMAAIAEMELVDAPDDAATPAPTARTRLPHAASDGSLSSFDAANWAEI